jgi:hypothetical protein
MKLESIATDPVQKLDNPVFFTAFCVKPGFRYQALKPYCKNIEFVTDGFATDLALIATQIEISLAKFDPDRDCIVPTGTGIVNILVGYYLAAKFPLSSLAVAFFQKETQKHNRVVVPEDYEFYRIYPAQAMNLWS